METFATMLLVLHIIAGFTALLTGTVALSTHKGGKIHAFSGRIFFWAMSGILVTALSLSVIHPNIFLFMVGVFSFYMAFTGYRVLHTGKPKQQATAFDWIISGLTLITGLCMLLNGLLSLPAFIFRVHPVLLVFGAICTGFSIRDLQRYSKGFQDKQAWLFVHITRMCGGFIATVTAFLVTNVNFLPELVVWLAPTAIGSIGIGFTIRKYRMKLQRPKTMA